MFVLMIGCSEISVRFLLALCNSAFLDDSRDGDISFAFAACTRDKDYFSSSTLIAYEEGFLSCDMSEGLDFCEL